MADNLTKTIIVGLSGPSSSGKTTLARLLRELFNITIDNLTITLFIVHEDDFYKTDVELQDWDCVESLDLHLIERITTHIKAHGKLPSDFASKEDQNSVGDTHIPKDDLIAIKEEVHKRLTLQIQQASSNNRNNIKSLQICILEGFLLFPPPPPPSSSIPTSGVSPPRFFPTSPAQLSELTAVLAPNLDLKIFLPSTKQQTISRRAARSGYVTLEGFWEDPPGYVEELVWPNYVRDQGWLFGSAADVDEGIVNEDKARRAGILVGPGRGNQGMRLVLDWGVDLLEAQIQDLLR